MHDVHSLAAIGARYRYSELKAELDSLAATYPEVLNGTPKKRGRKPKTNGVAAVGVIPNFIPGATVVKKKRRKMSAAARKAIGAAQRARWAAKKAEMAAASKGGKKKGGKKKKAGKLDAAAT